LLVAVDQALAVMHRSGPDADQLRATVDAAIRVVALLLGESDTPVGSGASSSAR
jgi:hypothetical protein